MKVFVSKRPGLWVGIVARLGLLGLVYAPLAAAHAEHEKNRYVAPEGRDEGRCDHAQSPCKTLKYAALQAGKGDKVLVAQGRYEISDADTVFYLTSSTVSIAGGYTPGSYDLPVEPLPSVLVGVPTAFAEGLAERGFQVISDTKGFSRAQQQLLQGKQSAYRAMKQTQALTPCVNGKAGAFACSNMDLLAHLSFADLGSANSSGNDVWGFMDLNDGREYALMGLSQGISLVEVTDPLAPRWVGLVAGQTTVWRDLKVYQYFDRTRQRWMAFAYVTADAASEGTMIIDLTQLPNSVALIARETSDRSAHNIYLSNQDYSTGIALNNQLVVMHTAGSNQHGGGFNSYSLNNPLKPQSLYNNLSGSRSGYSHDLSSMRISDSRRAQCVDAQQDCDLLIDFNEDAFLLWDKTLQTQPKNLSTTSYPMASYVHSGWWTEDKQTVIVHDELDELNYSLNTHIRFFAVSDLTRPQLVGEYRGPTRAIDHNGFVRGNRYYFSNYERGLVVLDISDVTKPVETAWFDSYPLNNSAAFNGAWGVYPFLPSGTLLISDINSGLYLVRDTSTNSRGQLQFVDKQQRAGEGALVQLKVARRGGSQGAVSVAIEALNGTAQEDSDYRLGASSLQWADGDSADKTLEVELIADANEREFSELFMLRLVNPQGGASLAPPAMTQVTIAGMASVGELEFPLEALSLQEGGAALPLTVTRKNGAGELRLELQLVTEDSGMRDYFTLEADHLYWEDAELGEKSVNLHLADNQRPDGVRNLQLRLINRAVDADPGSLIELMLLDAQSPVTSSNAVASSASQTSRPPASPKSSGGGLGLLALALLALLMVGGVKQANLVQKNP